MITVTLTEEELQLIDEALDSHRYWQLSDERYRDSGEVEYPGSDDEENQEALKACEALSSKLGRLVPLPKS